MMATWRADNLFCSALRQNTGDCLSLRKYDDRSSNTDASVEVNDVGIEHPNTAG